VRKEDCLDLPPKVYERIYVDLSPEQRRIYENLKTELLAEYEDKEISVTNKVALTTRLMQVVGGFFPFMRDEQHFSIDGPYMKQVGDGKLIGKTSV
jgi:SNF2 family DNA or RNA helicase